MAGMTSDNIEELDILTYDGLRMQVGKTSDEELDQIIATTPAAQTQIKRNQDELEAKSKRNLQDQQALEATAKTNLTQADSRRNYVEGVLLGDWFPTVEVDKAIDFKGDLAHGEAWVKYKAEDILLDGSIDYVFGEIMDHVDGRNHIVIADIDDFDEACWDEWKEKKKVEVLPK